MKRILSLGAILLASTLSLSAQKAMTAPAGGKAISDELIGIFFEDISSSADGGLYAELIQNGSFEFSPVERDGWGPGTAWRMVRPGHSTGYMQPMQLNPIHPNNPNYMRLHTERAKQYYDYNGWTGFGISNNGFDGINVKKGASYDFSAFFRNVKGDAKKVRVVLTVTQGFNQQRSLGELEFTVSNSSWNKFSGTITATEDSPNASLQILCLTVGDMDVDMVSLMPQDTYKGHGLRKDLAQALADLKPKFMRFPGGCVVHGGGDGFWTKDESPDIVSNMSARDLLDAISKMPDGYRTIFNMYVIEGYQHNEIAEKLNITESTSRSQLKKAREYLIEIIKNDFKR